jgi:hypothetical protein
MLRMEATFAPVGLILFHFVVLGFYSQGLVLARQLLYHLHPTSGLELTLHCQRYMWVLIESHKNILSDPPCLLILTLVFLRWAMALERLSVFYTLV